MSVRLVRRLVPLTLALPVAFAPVPAHANHGGNAPLSAVLRTAAGATVGTVQFADHADGTAVTVRLDGATQGFHGIHVHSVGLCDGSTTPPFTSAGGHFAAAGATHGAHAGDLPAMYVGADGKASAYFTTDALTLAQLTDADGSAVVLHADRDNLANIPTRYRHGAFADTETGPDTATKNTGDAGARFACGAIAAAGDAVGADTAAIETFNRGRATIRDAAGTVTGSVVIDRTPRGTRITADVGSLTPGWHGMHIHSVGTCDPSGATPFGSAGGHLAGAEGATHGTHAGDLPPLYARADGRATAVYEGPLATLDALFDADGAAVIVHAAPDNLAHIPTRYRYGTFTDTESGPDTATKNTGDSGGRVRCGVVERTAGTFFPVGAVRVLDTRPGGLTARFGPGEVRRVRVTGRGAVPANGVAAVLVNLTATQPSVATYCSIAESLIGPAGYDLPVAQGATRSTLVPVPVAPDGTVSIANRYGRGHVIAQVVGWFSDGTTGAGRRYRDRVDQRLLDTRKTAPARAGATVTLNQSELAGKTAVLRVTAIGGSAAGEVDSAAAGHLVSAGRGEAATNLVTLAFDGSGRATLRVRVAPLHLIIDAVGVFDATGLRYAPGSPLTVLDTRRGARFQPGESRLVGHAAINDGVPVLQVTLTAPSVAAALSVRRPAVASVIGYDVTGPARGSATGVVWADEPNPMSASPVAGLTFTARNGDPHVIAVVLGAFRP